ncbi:PIN-like domain-containing protein [Bacillus subtilis]|uniref:PIN-like domain-containing protein n=1 Tax=Bacillus subtilis TaxID=1423 RepID=UPI00103B31E0|nr:PIN-like domain-containing protein [Bacillus subtilis]QHL55821.1 hypothetical protein C7M23_02947 [Bacillus subtilis]
MGEPYSQEQLNELYIEGENRFENSVPPGYKDIDKGDAKRYFDGLDYTKKYGDLVLWKQIIDFAKSKKTDIIFVTDDNKEDWWLISHGKTLGPHPEIIQEFKRETDGNNIYIYKTKQFLESCKDSETFLIPSARIDKAIDSINQYKKSVKDNEEALNAQLQKEKLEFEEELKKEIKMKSLGLSSEYLKEYNKKTKFNFLRTYQITALVDKDVNDSYRLLSKRIVNTHSKLYNYEPYSVRIAGQGNIGSSSDVLKINIKSPEEIHTNLFKKLLNDSCDVKTIYILEMKEISIEDLNEFAFTETNLHE